MHVDQAPYRDLLALLAAAADHQLASVVATWLDTHADQRAFFVAFAARTGAPIPAASPEELWRLYALSRNHDHLVTRLAAQPDPALRATIADAHVALLTTLGLQPLAPRPFHPFFHEIVAAQPAPAADAPITLVDPVWSGFHLGPLLFARAGVRVRGGADHLDPHIATTSVLYWAHRRAHRPTTDLSAGWGSNSQWRTPFRRDYLLAHHFHYNVDARPSLPSDLTPHQRLELLRHRAFIHSPLPSTDLFPYHDHATEPAGEERLEA